MPLIGVWFVAMSISFIGAYAWTTKRKIEIDRANRLIKIPGSCVPLILLLTFFSCKYIIGVMYALNPLLKQNDLIITIGLLFSGFISGCSLGRFATLLKMYLRAI